MVRYSVQFIKKIFKFKMLRIFKKKLVIYGIDYSKPEKTIIKY
jgi:hypothetical protein